MANTVDKIISIAKAEVGYLEKKSNSQLDSKKANAGYNNYTKYARDLDAISGFYNGKKNGYPWCDVFFDWCCVKAYGVDNAKKLLCQPDRSLGAGCSYSAKYYRDKGQFYTSPQIGDQIFFGKKGDESHTGLVYKVDNKYVYTIEGNTSSASGVVANGGGVFEKKYALSYSKIAGYGRPNFDVIPSSQPSTTTRILKIGSQGNDVKELQNNLNSLGYNCGAADGIMGNKTLTALKQFQKANGLTVDGIYGDNSRKKMNEVLAKKNSPSSIVIPSTYTQKQFIKDIQSAIGVTVDGIVGSKTLSALPTVSRSKNNTHKVVKPLQQYLNSLGYNCGEVDGIAGSKFDNAAKAWARANGCVADGEFTKGGKSWNRILGVI